MTTVDARGGIPVFDPHCSSQFEAAVQTKGRLSRLLAPPMPRLGLAARTYLQGRITRVSRSIPCAHEETEILSFNYAVLALPEAVEGCVVECGAFKGGSTAKFSLVAELVGRRLCVFDSFEGLPDNDENHVRSILGHSIENWFDPGGFNCSLDEVKSTVTKYGAIDVCTFVQGYYEDTMPGFREPVAAVYIDVDLASSTKTCLKHLWPLLSPGGVIMSQDGDFPLVIEAYDDDEFWETEVGCPKPVIDGLGTRKIITITKPAP
jgi:O-methyltransferase